MPCPEDAQALTMAKLGPPARVWMDTSPAAMSAIIIGTVKGDIRRTPRSFRAVWFFSISSMPPTPEETMTPTSSGSNFAGSRFACSSACLEAASANWQ